MVALASCGPAEISVLQTQTLQRSRDEEALLIYSLLITEGCKEKTQQTLPPTFILSETYYDPGFDDEYVSWKEPSINQQTLDDYRAIGQEKQILDPILVPISWTLF